MLLELLVHLLFVHVGVAVKQALGQGVILSFNSVGFAFAHGQVKGINRRFRSGAREGDAGH